MSNFVNLLDIVYPVGSIYQTMSATSPADFIGGTWTKINTFLYGADTTNQTGGEATHTLTIDEMPNHHHKLWVSTWASGLGGSSVTCSNIASNYLSSNDNQGNFTGGGQRTTTCHPTQHASSGTEQRSCAESEQLKSKRGSVCLTTLTSWILSTQWGQSLSQIIQSHQQIQSAGHGQSSTATHLFAAARPMKQAGRTKENFLSQICRQMFGLQVVLVRILACLKLWAFYLVPAICMALKHGVSLTIQMNNILISHLTIAPNTGLLTSISAQPSYILGGVA